MKVERKINVAATPVEAFAKISDTRLVASLFTGFMDWYPTPEANRFRTVFRAGPAPLGGEIEVEFWPESGTVVWQSTRGVYTRGRFMVRKKEVGSEVVLRIFYHLDGGLFSRVSEWVFARTVNHYMEEALDRLRRSIEAQPPRLPRRRREAAETSASA